MEKLQQKYTSVTSIYITQFGLQPYRYYSSIVNRQLFFNAMGRCPVPFIACWRGRISSVYRNNKSKRRRQCFRRRIEKSDDRKDCALLSSSYIMHLRAHDLGHPNAHAYIIIDDTYFTTTVIMRITVISRRDAARGVVAWGFTKYNNNNNNTVYSYDVRIHEYV